MAGRQADTQFLTPLLSNAKLLVMKPRGLSRPKLAWLVAFLAVAITLGSLCDIVGEAHAVTVERESGSDQADTQHDESVVHLIFCEAAALPASPTYSIAHDVAASLPTLEASSPPLPIRTLAISKVFVSLSGPPLFVRHAALII